MWMSTRSAVWSLLRGVLAAARDCAYIAEITTVAFPQEGILRDPGAADLLAEAMKAGADVVGGMPHWERSEDDQREHVRICFDIAESFDADVDMHVDETDDGSVRTLAMVADETLRRGWQGRVTAGHVCSLSAADDAYAARRDREVRRSRDHRGGEPDDQPRAPGPRGQGAHPAGHHPDWRAACRGGECGVRAGLRVRRLHAFRARRHAGGRP